MKNEVIILGAGLAGLSTAYHLQKRAVECRLFEKEEEPGGLCRSKYIKGFTFDYDAHLLHFRRQYVFKLIGEIAPFVFASHRRNSWVFSYDRYTRYPFQANTYGLPHKVVADCLLGLTRARLKNYTFRFPWRGAQKNYQGNFKEWLFKTFGKGISNHFMVPYNAKFWTVPLAELTSEGLDEYIPVASLKDAFRGGFFNHSKAFGYNQQFWYPYRGGIDSITKAFQNHIRGLNTQKEVVSIDIGKKVIEFKDGEKLEYTKVVSSLPLIEMQKIIKNIPASIAEALNKLKYVSIFNLNLGINKRNISDKHWIYFPEHKYTFFRIGFSSNFSLNVAPKGKSSLYTEVSYSHSKPLDKGVVVSQIIKDLMRLNILNNENDIVVRDINDIKYGYCLCDSQHSKTTKQILDFLNHNGIYSIGRFGRWRYMSMEDTILDGKHIAETI